MVEENLPGAISKSVVFLKRAFVRMSSIRSLSVGFKEDIFQTIEEGEKIERDMKFPKTDGSIFLVKLFRYVNDFEKAVIKIQNNTALGIDDLLIEIIGELKRTVANTYQLEYLKPLNKIGKSVQDLISLIQSKPPNN